MDANPATESLRRELLRHARWLERLARHLVREEEAAADLAQDTILAALRRPPARLGELRPWLARVMRNRVTDLSRRRERQRARETAVAADERQADTTEVVERLELEQGLLDAVRGLDEPYRTAITLRYLEGREPGVIAKQLGIPAGTVRWRVSEGLTRLRRTLDRDRGGRTHWMRLYLPLAGLPVTELEVGAAVGTSTLLLLPPLLMKLTLASAVLAALVLLVWSRLADSDAPTSLTRGDDPELLAPPSPERAAPAVVALTPDDSARREVAVPSAPAAVVEEGAAPYPVRVRVVDEDGRPLAGVRVASVYVQPREFMGTTDGQGRFEHLWAEPAMGHMLHLALSAVARESLELSEEIAGEDLDFGTVTLRRGMSISGRVVDERGAPWKGARVSADDGAGWLLSKSLGTDFTDAEGHFEFVGVPLGFVHLAARLDGDAPDRTFETLVELAEHTPAPDITIVVPNPAGPGLTSGIVRRPDGTPAPYALLRVRAENEDSANTWSVDVDAEGRFAIEGWRYDEYEVEVTDRDTPTLRLLGVTLARGDIDVELRLTEVALVRLVVRDHGGRDLGAIVRDASGAVIAGFEAHTVIERPGQGADWDPLNATTIDGKRFFAPPLVPYSIDVRAVGFHPRRTEVFDPATTRESIELVLEPLPRVSGRVRRDGRPVAGARVRLLQAVTGHTVLHVDGLRSEWRTLDTSPPAVTDADGAFAIPYLPPPPPEAPGFLARLRGERAEPVPPFAIDVNADADGTAFVAPLDLATGEPPTAREISLVPGGTIEGRLLLDGAAEPSRCWILAGCGRAATRAVRPDAEGWYRFAHLGPGPWMVRNAGPTGKPGNTVSSSWAESPGALAWDCEVRAGEVTRFDIDERNATRLSGRLLVDGAGPGPWTVVLWRDPDVVGERAKFAGLGALDADGSFVLEPSQHGGHELSLHGDLRADGGKAELYVPLEIFAGANAWALELTTAPIAGRCSADCDTENLQLRAALAEGGVWMVPLEPDAEGAFRATAPPGEVEVVRARPDDPLGEPAETLRVFTLPAPGVTDLLLGD